MEELRERIEETVNYVLNSHINETLEVDLHLSQHFCSHLLTHEDEPNDSVVSLTHSAHTTTGSFGGVPEYPLFKRLASALYQSIISGSFCKSYDKIGFINEDISLEQKEEQWNKLILEIGSELINVFKATSLELHVQEPYFSLLKDGIKTIEGRCAGGNYSRIGPGDLLLINKSVVLEVEDVHRYPSFLEMLEAEGLPKVLPGVKTIEEGVQVYRKFYTEEKELSEGVLAICVSKFACQPYLSLASMLSGFSYSGIQSLLGIAQTVGTVSDALPPRRSILLSSFNLPYRPNLEVKGSSLSHGARALAKHSERSSDKYWGTLDGSDSSKNVTALNVITRLIASCRWLNVHLVPQHGAVFEIRMADGYGARWSKDGTKFIGFLEPYMEDGYEKGWKH